jgi:hypothetical protein
VAVDESGQIPLGAELHDDVLRERRFDIVFEVDDVDVVELSEELEMRWAYLVILPLAGSERVCWKDAVARSTGGREGLKMESSRRASEKKKLYGSLLNVPFAPLCITVGSMLEKEAMEPMEAWRKVVGKGGYRFMMRRISMFLARARAKVWRFE